MREFIKKAKGEECLVSEVLVDLALQYNSKFKRLRLPEPIRIDKEKNEVVLEYYVGKTYDEVWHKIYGGKLMGLELPKEVAQVLYDLTIIDTKPIEEDERINKIPFFKFNFNDWNANFKKRANKFIEIGWLIPKDVKLASEIFDTEFESKFIFNNGDFYPGNFINQDNKIILIDWQTWDTNYRANLVDYWENVLAFNFIHMWTNPAWQLEFLKEAKKHFTLDPENFQKAVLIKSFEQAFYWLQNKQTEKQAKDQIGIFKKFLNREYVDHLLE